MDARRRYLLRPIPIALVAIMAVAVPPFAGAQADRNAAEGAGRKAAVERELIYGSELMTDAELDRYRADMQKATTPEAREAYRTRHRAQIRERSRLRGQPLREPEGVLDRPEPR